MAALLQFLGAKRIPQWAQARLGLLAADAWLQAPNNVQPVGFALFEFISARHHLGLHHHWRENIRSISRHCTVESALRHPHHCERLAVDQDGLVQQVAICSEPPLPVIEAEYRYGIGVRDGVVRLHQQPP